MQSDNANTQCPRPASDQLLFDGPIGPQGFVQFAAVVTRNVTLAVEVTPRGVEVTFGDGTDEGDDDFSVTLQGDGARLMMEACAAHLGLPRSRPA